MEKAALFKLVDKYLAGEVSPEEEQLLFQAYEDQKKRSEISIEEMEEVSRTGQRIRSNLQSIIADDLKNNSRGQDTRRSLLIRPMFYKAVASVLLVISVALFFLSPAKHKEVALVQAFQLTSADYVIKENKTQSIEHVIFPDKSFVDLSPNSTIVYKKQFVSNRRDVYLDGNGFFQVTKNHSSPFIVYTRHLVAKVLGTSFVVKGGMTENKPSILVKTGKVSVYKTDEFNNKYAKAELTTGIVLTPNHSAALSPDRTVKKGLSESPELLDATDKMVFSFDSTPVRVVFGQLEKAYGIKIIFDNDKFDSCTITANMGKEDFYKKLNVICASLNATYKSHDGNLYIDGEGCNN